MSPHQKRARTTKTEPSSSTDTPTSISTPIEDYGIIFRNDTHRKDFIKLSSREMGPTKFADLDTLEALGVRDDVERLFRRQGWSTFLGLSEPTYPRLTLEFLSSLGHRCASPETKTKADGETIEVNNDDYSLTFRLFNREYELSYSEIAQMFGWTEHGSYRPTNNFKQVPGYSPSSFWSEITGRNQFVSGRVKSSCIVNPCISLSHRILKCSLLGGGGKSLGSLHNKELFLLWALLNKEETKVDTSHWLAETLLTAKEKGPICCGGLVTLLATRAMKRRRPLLARIPKGTKVLDGDHLIDIAALTRMKLIAARPNKTYSWEVRGTVYMILPATQSTTLSNRNNWLPVQLPQPPLVLSATNNGEPATPSHDKSASTDISPKLLPVFPSQINEYVTSQIAQSCREPDEDVGLNSNSRGEKDGETQPGLKDSNGKDEKGVMQSIVKIESDSENQDDEYDEMQYDMIGQDKEHEEITRKLPSMNGGSYATEKGTTIMKNITQSIPRRERACASSTTKNQPATAKFEGFDIRSDLVTTLQKIWQRHGNIIENSFMRNGEIIAKALESLATMVRILEDNSPQSLSGSQAEYLTKTLSDLRGICFKVHWLLPFVEKAVKLHESKPLLDSLSNLRHLNSQANERRMILYDELAKLGEEENKRNEEIAKVSKMIPFFGQVNFDEPLGLGLT